MAQPQDSHVAHFNWGLLRGDPGDAVVQPFFDAVDHVNAIAERSPGFVWRHGDEDGAARQAGWPLFTAHPRMIASFSVWETTDHFRHFVYTTLHGRFFKRRDEWFAPGGGPNYVLWWVAKGHIPSIKEAWSHVDDLTANGPAETSFLLPPA